MTTMMSAVSWDSVSAIVGAAIFFLLQIAVKWFTSLDIEGVRFRNAQTSNRERIMLKALQDRRAYIGIERYNRYRETWEALEGVSGAAENLWIKATQKKLELFSDKVGRAQSAVGQARPLLRDEYYNQVQKALATFTEYGYGKRRLIDMRGTSLPLLADESVQSSPQECETQIEENRRIRQEYDWLLEEICLQWRRDIQAS
jgi:hypothetical protein